MCMLSIAVFLSYLSADFDIRLPCSKYFNSLYRLGIKKGIIVLKSLLYSKRVREVGRLAKSHENTAPELLALIS